MRRFVYNGTTLTPGSYSSPGIQEHARGSTPFISADGNANGILWMIDTGAPLQNTGGTAPTAAALRAYDALDLTIKLYDSSAKAADKPGLGIKFTSPVVANGKVYISTGHDDLTVSNPRGEIDVYGLK